MSLRSGTIKIGTMFAVTLLFLFSVSAFCSENTVTGRDTADQSGTTKIRIVFQQQEVVVVMFDNPASKDFIPLLPLSLEFRDFASAEKIATLPRRLNTAGAPTPHEATGDFTYYAPWGNLAVFYKGFGNDGQLYVLGRILSGKDALAKSGAPFTARIERAE